MFPHGVRLQGHITWLAQRSRQMSRLRPLVRLMKAGSRTQTLITTIACPSVLISDISAVLSFLLAAVARVPPPTHLMVIPSTNVCGESRRCTVDRRDTHRHVCQPILSGMYESQQWRRHMLSRSAKAVLTCLMVQSSESSIEPIEDRHAWGWTPIKIDQHNY